MRCSSRRRPLTTADRRSYTADVEKEELELLDREEILQAGAQHLPADLVESWRKQGGLAHNVDRARSAARTILGGVDEAAADDFTSSFDGLPEGAISAIYANLALDPFTSARPAPASAVEEFAKLGAEAAAAVELWGEEAPAIIGRAKARFKSIEASMSAEDRTAALAWLDSRSPAEQAAIISALAGEGR